MATQNNIGIMTDAYLKKNGWNEWAKYVLMSLEELKAQNAKQETNIDTNKQAFVHAVNSLELTVTKEMGELKSELKILKTKFALRAVMWSSIIPAITAAALLLLKFLA